MLREGRASERSALFTHHQPNTLINHQPTAKPTGVAVLRLHPPVKLQHLAHLQARPGQLGYQGGIGSHDIFLVSYLIRSATNCDCMAIRPTVLHMNRPGARRSTLRLSDQLAKLHFGQHTFSSSADGQTCSAGCGSQAMEVPSSTTRA